MKGEQSLDDERRVQKGKRFVNACLQMDSHTSMKDGVIDWLRNNEAFAVLFSMSTMALMLAGDRTTSSVKLTVILRSRPTKDGRSTSFRNCGI